MAEVAQSASECSLGRLNECTEATSTSAHSCLLAAEELMKTTTANARTLHRVDAVCTIGSKSKPEISSALVEEDMKPELKPALNAVLLGSMPIHTCSLAEEIAQLKKRADERDKRADEADADMEQLKKRADEADAERVVGNWFEASRDQVAVRMERKWHGFRLGKYLRPWASLRKFVDAASPRQQQSLLSEVNDEAAQMFAITADSWEFLSMKVYQFYTEPMHGQISSAAEAIKMVDVMNLELGERFDPSTRTMHRFSAEEVSRARQLLKQVIGKTDPLRNPHAHQPSALGLQSAFTENAFAAAGTSQQMPMRGSSASSKRRRSSDASHSTSSQRAVGEGDATQRIRKQCEPHSLSSSSRNRSKSRSRSHHHHRLHRDRQHEESTLHARGSHHRLSEGQKRKQK